MSNDVLRAFIVSLGFKVDEAGAKKQREAICKTERAVAGLEKAERDAHEASARRAAELARRAEGMAATGRLASSGLLAFAAVATTAVTALALHLQKSLGEFDRLYYVAGRTGASVNNIKALGHAFEQTGSSAARAMGMLESFAKARRTNPGVDAMLKNYGVDTKGDASDVLSNGIDAITKRHPHFSGSQVAGILGISEEDYEHWNRTRPEREKFAKEYKALQRSLGVNGNEVASNAAKISQAYGSFSAVIEVVGQRITQTFAPAIERVVKGFRDWIDAHSETLTGIMQSLAKALEWVGDKLVVIADWTTDKGKLFGDFWLKTYGYIEKIVDVVKVLLDLLFKLNAAMMAGPVGKYMDFMFGGGLAGKLFGGSAQAAEGAAIGGASYLGQEPANDTGKAKPGLVRRGIDAMKRAVGLGPKQDKSDYNFTGENADVLRQAAKELGTSPKDLATVISYESKFSPSVHGGTGNRYHGLIQFGGPERAMYGANDKQTFKEQMPAVVRYLKSRGFKPGMGLLDLYSTINAGRPGRYDASDGHGTVRSHVAKMERDEAARVARFLSSGSGTTAAPVAPRPIAGGFNPGSFDVNAYLRSAPLGATSTTNNQSSMNVNSPTNVTIHGVTDPQKAAEHFERAANRSNNEMLRNVQTAAR